MSLNSFVNLVHFATILEQHLNHSHFHHPVLRAWCTAFIPTLEYVQIFAHFESRLKLRPSNLFRSCFMPVNNENADSGDEYDT